MSAVPTPSRADRRYRLAAHALLVIISVYQGGSGVRAR
jgi:N-acetylglucosamine transport system permease protein